MRGSLVSLGLSEAGGRSAGAHIDRSHVRGSLVSLGLSQGRGVAPRGPTQTGAT